MCMICLLYTSPASLLATKYVEDLNVWLQKDVEAKIITVEPEEQRLVLSAKAVEKEKERKERENKINELKVGTVVEGTVENLSLIHILEAASMDVLMLESKR